MFKDKIYRITDKISEYLILATVFFVPIYFSVFLKNANVFELNKMVLFRCLTLLLLATTLIRSLYGWRKEKSNITRRYKLLLVPAIYVLTFAFISIFSVNIEASIYGYYNRQQGLVSQAYYFLFFALLLVNISDMKLMKKSVVAVFFSSLPIGIYGIVQFFGFDPLLWIEDSSYRITGTFGQPNFFASYLLLLMPLGFYLYNQFKPRLLKISVLIVFLIQLFCLYATYSRAAWLALALGSIIIVTIFAFTANKEKLFNKKTLVVFSLFVLLTIVGFSTSQMARARFKLLFNIGVDSVASRINTWQASVDAIKKRPIIGYGLETQSEVFANYYRKDWAYLNNVNSYPNRAHNFVLDDLLTGGIIGFFAYMSLLAWFFYMAYRNVRNKKETSLVFSLATAVFIYHIALLFGFSVVSTDMILWFYVALMAIIFSDFSVSERPLLFQKSRKSKLIKTAKILTAVIVILGAFYLVSRELKRLVADYYFRELQVAFVERDYFATFALDKLIQECDVRNTYYNVMYGRMLAEEVPFIFEFSFVTPIKDKLKELLLRVNNNGFEERIFKALSYRAIADGTGDDYERSEAILEELTAESPEMPVLHRYLAELYLSGKEYDKSVVNYLLALNALPDVENSTTSFAVLESGDTEHPFVNDKHKNVILNEAVFAYIGLGESYAGLKEYDKALESFDTAEQIKPTYYLYGKMAYLFKDTKDYDKAIAYFDKAWQGDANNYIWPYEIARIYYSKGDNNEAMRNAVMAKELFPNSQQIKKLIKNIKANTN